MGSVIVVYARQLKVVDYADVFTRKKFEVKRAKFEKYHKINNFFKKKFRTFAMIKPDAYTKMGKIIDAIEKNGFLISNLKMVRFSLRDAQEFYAEHQVKFSMNELTIYFIIYDSLGKTLLRRAYQIYEQRFCGRNGVGGRELRAKMEKSYWPDKLSCSKS